MAEDERMEVGGGLAEEEEVAVVVHDAAETEGAVQFSLKGSREESFDKVDNLRSLLDDMEDQVQKVRAQVISLMEEKEDIQTTLEMIGTPDQLTGISDIDREEIEATVERLSQRINAVNINISTARTANQQECLHHVNRAIDLLIVQIQTDTMQANVLCRQYLSAAGCDIETSMPSDARFEEQLLGCTVEDQKSVKKRLLGLLDHIKVIVCDSIKETGQDEECN